MISSITLFKRSLNIFKDNFNRYVMIMAVPAVLTLILAFFEPNEAELGVNPSAMISYTILLILSVLVSIFMTIALVHATADAALSAKDAYKLAQGQFLKYIGYTIVLTVILMVGFALLIIPGIWLSILFSFSVYFLLLERMSIKASLTASKDLVKGKWWAVALRALFLIVVAILFFALLSLLRPLLGESVFYLFSSLIGVLVTPIGIIYMYELYKDLRGNALETPAESQVIPETVV